MAENLHFAASWEKVRKLSLVPIGGIGVVVCGADDTYFCMLGSMASLDTRKFVIS